MRLAKRNGLAAYFAETAMAKAKKRVAPRKKSSKRGKASAKPARKKTAKRAMPKRAKSRRAGMSATKSAAESVRTGTPVSPGGEPEHDENTGPET
jgi:hypothetical protein